MEFLSARRRSPRPTAKSLSGAVGGHRRGTVVFTPLALALAIGGGFYARANAPRGIVAPFVALAIANLLLLVVVGLSLTVSGGGSSSWG